MSEGIELIGLSFQLLFYLALFLLSLIIMFSPIWIPLLIVIRLRKNKKKSGLRVINGGKKDEQKLVRREIDRRQSRRPVLLENRRKGKTLAEIKGEEGEDRIINSLQYVPGYHKFIRNAYMPKSNGDLTEIDIIMLHEKGIFVIESKAYDGWIFGGEDRKKWCQMFPNGDKFFFNNPIWQNKGHMKALEFNILNDLGLKIGGLMDSIIVFNVSRNGGLKENDYYSSNVTVIENRELLSTMSRKFSEYENVLDKGEIDGIYDYLQQFENASEHVKNTHKEQIKSKMNR